VSGVDLDAVGALVREVAQSVVLPRFRDLAAGEISEKSPGDLVTAVDLEAERVLTAGLQEIAPEVPVVGEEAVAADSSLLGLLGREGLSFVVDPIDGTRAFVEGDPDFAVMVALVDSGTPVAAWVALPEYDELFAAERGAGTFLTRGSGSPERVRRGEAPTTADGARRNVRGGVATFFLPEGLRERIGERVEELAPEVRANDRLWAGATYRRVLLGEDDFIVYWRTNAWDHAPGALLVREAGGISQRWDGSDYRADDERSSLLVASSPLVAAEVRSTLGL